MKKTIWITFQREGIHCYPAAADLEGVEFLQYPHRHMFHFRVEMEVFHDDRDIEFILLKRELEQLFNAGVMQLDYKSCEMVAVELIEYIQKEYPNRWTSVSVSEDHENGATVTT